MGRTLEVSGDDVKASESTGGFLYPAGDYLGVIIDAKETAYAKKGDNKDKPALNIKVRFTESGTGKGVGKKFVAWNVPDFPTSAKGGNMFIFFQFYKALGVVFPKEGETGTIELPEPIEMMDQEIGLTLEIEESAGYAPKNKVKAFFPASNGVKVLDVAADADGDDFAL